MATFSVNRRACIHAYVGWCICTFTLILLQLLITSFATTWVGESEYYMGLIGRDFH